MTSLIHCVAINLPLLLHCSRFISAPFCSGSHLVHKIEGFDSRVVQVGECVCTACLVVRTHLYSCVVGQKVQTMWDQRNDLWSVNFDSWVVMQLYWMDTKLICFGRNGKYLKRFLRLWFFRLPPPLPQTYLLMTAAKKLYLTRASGSLGIVFAYFKCLLLQYRRS